MPRASVEASASANFDDYGFYGLSVFARNGASADQIWHHTAEIAPPKYRKIRVTTVGALLDRGFQLIPTWDEPHFDIVLTDLQDATWEALDSVFSAPTTEPG